KNLLPRLRPRSQWVRAHFPRRRVEDAEIVGAAEPEPPLSAQRGTYRIHIERIDRRAAGHEQPVALRAAEAEVSDNFRRVQESQQIAARGMDSHAVRIDSAPAPADQTLPSVLQGILS